MKGPDGGERLSVTHVTGLAHPEAPPPVPNPKKEE